MGKRGAVLFSNDIINFFNHSVIEEKDTQEEEFLLDETETVDVRNNIAIENEDPFRKIEKYIERSYDLNRLDEIKQKINNRIQTLEELMEHNCADLKKLPSSNPQKSDPILKKKKKRIQPDLISPIIISSE